MGVRWATILEAYGQTWNMCLAMLLFFVAVALLARFLNARCLDFDIPSRGVFWVCVVLAFILMSICLTLIDKPRFAVSDVALDWMFMFSAFLGIPATLPLLAGAIWASAHRLYRMPVQASSLTLVMLGMFAIGCAASNIHDVVWCGAITGWYARHQAAGYDLDYFVAFGNMFGISREVLADYATLGPCAIVLVLGETVVAVACFQRLGGLSRCDAANARPQGR